MIASKLLLIAPHSLLIYLLAFCFGRADAAEITITEQPQSTNAPAYILVTLAVQAVSHRGEPLQYAWYEGERYLWNTNSSLSMSTFPGFPRGPIYAVISDSSGSITSAPVYVECYGVVEWGDDSAGQRPIPSNLKGVSAVALGDFSVYGLMDDGQITGWGNSGTPPSGLGQTVSMSKRQPRALSLTAAGLVQEWQGTSAITHPALSNIVAVSAGCGHSLALRADGSVYAWGNGFAGQTTVPAGLSDVVAVAAGAYHSVALKADGTVVAWGSVGRAESDKVPPGLRRAVSIAAGLYETFAIHEDGTVTIWGKDPYVSDADRPAVPVLTNVVKIASHSHTIAVTGDGRVIVWGPDLRGETQVPYWVQDVTDIAANFATSAVVMGKRPPFLTSPLPSRAVEAGRSTHFVISANGSFPLFYQWRLNSEDIPGQTNRVLSLWNVQPADQGRYSVQVRNAYGEAVSAEATLDIVGFSIDRQPQNAQSFLGKEVSFDVEVMSGVPVNYQWYFEGNPIFAATNRVLSLTNLRPEQAGKYWVVVQNELMTNRSADAVLTLKALDASVSPNAQKAVEGTIPFFQANVQGVEPFTYQWQFNGSDLPGETGSRLALIDVQQTQAGAYSVVVSNQYGVATSTAAQLTVEPVSYWLDTSADPSIPLAATNAVSLKEGVLHTIALLADGNVLAWGDGSRGQTNTPPGLAGVTQIDAGSFHNVVLLTNGTVVSWGGNSAGVAITPPANLTEVIAVSAGGSHDLALRKDGTVVSWGDGGYYGLTNCPAEATDIAAIAAGYILDVALKRDGSIISWGAPYFKPPPGLNDVIAVASGQSHHVALRANGTVVAWGENGSGQTNVPNELSDVVSIAASSGLSMALKSDGSVVAWGKYWHTGTSNAPVGMGNVVSISAGQTQLLRVIAYGVPYLTAQPWDQTVSLGGKARFVAKSVSSKPTKCQWQHNDRDLPGATNSVLEISNAQPADAGSYAAVVSNELGSTLTRKAKLKVTTDAPTVLDRPTCQGNEMTITINSVPGAVLQIESTTDLQQWSSLHTVTNVTGRLSLTYPLGPLGTFYRAKRL